MPTPLPQPLTFTSLQQWIFENTQGSINANPAMLNQVPQEKGIYFFFVHPDGYKELSRFIAIHPLQTLIIDKNGYHLIYLGTAGTGKDGGGHLFQRLNWHLTQNHTNGAICSGTLSTLRAGLGALLSNDLILYPNSSTEQEVNAFLEEYCRIYWISYKEVERINNDEFQLIQILRPLLNIRNNPNALAAAPNNQTKAYKKRRIEIYQDTKTRIGCNNNADNTLKSEAFQHQLIQNHDFAMEISFLQNQSIHEVLNGIEDLPEGRCSFILRNANDPNQLIYPSTHNNGWRKTGRGQQNIYTYFNAPDPANNNLYKWQVIQQEMQENNITEAIIRIVVEENENDSKDVTENLTPNKPKPQKTSSEENETDTGILSRYKKVLFLIPCSSSKIIGGAPLPVGDTYFDNPVTAGALIAARQAPIFANNPNLIIGPPNDLMPAWNRYNGQMYKRLREEQPLINLLLQNNIIDIAIVSAYYGVVNYNTQICNYDLLMGTHGVTPHWRNPNTIAEAVNEYCNANEISFIHSFLTPTSYYKAAVGLGNVLNPHMNHWPVGIRGNNNIYNYVADSAIALLYYLRRVHFGY